MSGWCGIHQGHDPTCAACDTDMDCSLGGAENCQTCGGQDVHTLDARGWHDHCTDCGPSSPENVEGCGHSRGELWAHEECEIDRSRTENVESPGVSQ